MKNAHALLRCGALLGAGLLVARGDGNNATPPAPAASPASATNPTGPWLMWAPPARPDTGDAPEWNGATGDGVGQGGSGEAQAADPQNAERIAEETYQMNAEKQQHPETADFSQEAKQQAYDDDWMLRNYTEQLKKQHLEKSDYTNPYLAQDPGAVDAPKPLLSDEPMLDEPGTKKPVKPSATRSPFDNASALSPQKPLVSLSFQPLLTPLANTTPTTHADDFGAFTDTDAATGATLLPVPNAPSSNLTTSPDGSIASLLDVPGLTAASQGGVPATSGIDLDDSGERSKTRPVDNFLLPAAVPGNDVSEFFKKQALALSPTGLSGSTPTVMVVPRPRVILDPEPTAKPPVTSLRSHVDDPFDILQR